MDSILPPGERPRILVAEDEPDLLKMLVHVTAVDGADALDKAKTGPAPDVVVTDLMMPHMDGLTLARELKADPQLAKVPVVMLTARTGPRDVIEGINAGARYYVTKPFKTEELVSKVRQALGQRK